MLGARAPYAVGYELIPADGSPYQFAAFPESVSSGDLNGDGRSDLTIGGSRIGGASDIQGQATVYGLVNNGLGFDPKPPWTALGTGGSSVTTADFNADGHLDVAEADDGGLWVLIGKGDGTFAPTPASPVSDGHRPSGVASGDLNSDGKPDVVIVNDAGTVSVWLGAGDATFVSGPAPPVTGTVGGFVIDDFNSDGVPDLATLSGPTVQGGTASLTMLLGKGDGTFTQAPGPSVSLGERSPGGLAAADLDGDGKRDLAIAAGDRAIVLLGHGDGSFTPAPGSPILVAESNLNGMVTGEFNGDGRLDIASGGGVYDHSVRTGVYVFLGDGSGRFRKAPGAPFPAMTPSGSSTGGPSVLGTTTIDDRSALVVNPGYYGDGQGELHVLVTPGPAPATKITKTINSSAKRSARLTFKATGEAERFQCHLKRGRRPTRWHACISPKRYQHLKPGKYVFAVRAVGPGGTDRTPARRTFTIR